MNLIELHILQSFPVSCLNRDDVGAPKSALFGGATRARVSSQCWKRAIREMAADSSISFGGKRGHYMAALLEKELVALGVACDCAAKISVEVIDGLFKTDKKSADEHKTPVSLYFSPGELNALAKEIKAQQDEKGKVEIKAVKKLLEKFPARDNADIAIFGRMVADDHTLMLEGAGLFSHALSTHKVVNDLDFFSAVDDIKPEDSEGAGHIGNLEFNSACYYRYVGLNLDLLADADHLGALTVEERRSVVEAFLRAAVLAVPGARKNSMFAANPPQHILGLFRKGQPLSLVNAFEKPVRSGDGLIEPSREALNAHYQNLKTLYGLEAEEHVLPRQTLNDLLKGLADHAV